jgi:hypothetical protein
MSDALDHTAPAEATGSTLMFSMTRTWPPTMSWGAATLECALSVAAVAIESRMPSGSKIRSRIVSAHGLWPAASMTAPAAAYMMFW